MPKYRNVITGATRIAKSWPGHGWLILRGDDEPEPEPVPTPAPVAVAVPKGKGKRSRKRAAAAAVVEELAAPAEFVDPEPLDEPIEDATDDEEEVS